MPAVCHLVSTIRFFGTATASAQTDDPGGIAIEEGLPVARRKYG